MQASPKQNSSSQPATTDRNQPQPTKSSHNQPELTHHLPVSGGVDPVVGDPDVRLPEHHAPDREVHAGRQGGGGGEDRDGAWIEWVGECGCGWVDVGGWIGWMGNS